MGLLCSQTNSLSTFYSTALNSKIKSYNDMATRILRFLGAPMVTVQIHQDQVYEAISQSIEMFTKFAGYTQEYLIFNSCLYECGKGIRMDVLFSITPDFDYRSPDGNKDIQSVYNIGKMIVGDPKEPFAFTVGELTETNQKKLNILESYDYLVQSHRKVIDCYDFQEGSNNGVNTLFTIEQTLAQQTYFSYSLGNYGFDLVSWYTLKNWLSVREKMLAIKRSIKFNPDTQMLTMYPDPGSEGSVGQFYGIVSCYVEKPISNLMKEQWIQQYALALCKIMVGNIRGAYTNIPLFGGGTINYQDFLSQGLKEKEELERRLYEGSAGLGDAPPPAFFLK